jgi:hypothetical protein
MRVMSRDMYGAKKDATKGFGRKYSLQTAVYGNEPHARSLKF